VKAAVDGSRKADAAKRAGSTAKEPVLEQGRDLLTRFSSHLDGHPKGVVDRKVFFTQDGTASGVPKAASQVLLAFSTITEQLGHADCPVRDRATWLEEFTATMLALGNSVDHSADSRTDRREATPVTEAARLAWLNTYISARNIVAGVLRFTGKLHLLSEIFYDLAVPSGTKVTTIVTDPAPGDPKLL